MTPHGAETACVTGSAPIEQSIEGCGSALNLRMCPLEVPFGACLYGVLGDVCHHRLAALTRVVKWRETGCMKGPAGEEAGRYTLRPERQLHGGITSALL
ncbi:hypothetical protein HaLaN_17492 [Haematococcus lacustris]|uniref:Uncharacterized protein n=1 Tax=Haematococcus lacustris TaxID=44745 RepID=A0A699ZE24_HAELA|nr:hypothetical protein HaLaN_17492 [Haematococcus lacustris]